MIKTINRPEEIIEFAWELSQNNLYASYPRNKSLKEVRVDIERAINAVNHNVIAYYDQNELLGICVYFWECDEKFAQTTEFLIKDNFEQVAEELIAYISKQLSGYELLIGVPFSNYNANQYFLKRNIECSEASIDTRLHNLNPQINIDHNQVEKITEGNFQDYESFHDKHAIPLGMYYTSKNLIKDMERFRVFIFKQDGVIYGSIFVFAVKDYAEVFGLLVDKEFKNKSIEGILISKMLMELYNEFRFVKEIVYFINEDCEDELNAALNAGFEIKDRYRCYKCLL